MNGNEPTRKELKSLPTWRGVKGTRYIWHGEWSDPEIYYKGYIFNVYDVEEGIEEEDLECPEILRSRLDDMIWAGCGEKYKEGDDTYLLARYIYGY